METLSKVHELKTVIFLFYRFILARQSTLFISVAFGELFIFCRHEILLVKEIYKQSFAVRLVRKKIKMKTLIIYPSLSTQMEILKISYQANSWKIFYFFILVGQSLSLG